MWTYEQTADGFVVLNGAGCVVEVCAAEWQAAATCELRNDRHLARQTRHDGVSL